MFTPIVLAGGTGSRLWPLSRQNFPKQFLALGGEESGTMLQLTLARLEGLAHTAPLVVSNTHHRFVVAEQLRQATADKRRIILEPSARNTAPAITLAALEACKDGDDPVLLILPADHYIENNEAFQDAVRAAQPYAENGKLVTFGVVPTHAETGFGYIQAGAPQGGSALAILAFKEKPSAELAGEYIASGEYFWNSGMFMFRASAFLSELERWSPELLGASQQALAHAEEDRDFLHIPDELFSLCSNISVDYAVMEHTLEGVMVPLDAGWSDLGSWAAIWEAGPRDADNNKISGDVIAVSTRNSLIQSHHRLVATVGLEDIVIVETKDAILVARKDRSQDVKEVVRLLQAADRPESVNHTLVSRPWGSYDTIDRGVRYQVKRISVMPGESLSLQMHYHRAEHWIVVSGTAKVICGEKELILSENQSTYIPLGTKHSLSNPGKVPLELIEVQSGTYLGEDDIVRFEDRYGRQ